MNDFGLVFALTGTVLGALLPGIGSATVSYTHLDVYKRQWRGIPVRELKL